MDTKLRLGVSMRLLGENVRFDGRHKKELRRIATRYDNLLESFRAFVLLGFIMIRLRDPSPYTP